MRSIRLLCFLLLCCAASAALAASDTPRARVDGVARAIEDAYFDPARGHEIADGLRAAAAAGAFDALANADALADALTVRLRPLDGHLRVRAARAGEVAPRHRGQPRVEAITDGILRVEVAAGGIGVLGLRAFADFAFGRDDQPERKAIDAALARLAGTRAMVIDLRGNRGGAPAMVGYLASAFLPRGADVFNTFRHRGGSDSEAPAEWYAKPRADVPLYVVVDHGTGSAAESFAYTLQQVGRATIVGERSGGAANPGAPVATPEGLVVFVPTGSPVNPISHDNWEGVGVRPDVPASSAGALDAALELAREAVASAG